MRVIVNGEDAEVAATDLTGLLGELDYTGTHVAVAVNHEMVPRQRWTAVALNNGDRIEILTPRQGG
jgi:sulfur carrier protein